MAHSSSSKKSEKEDSDSDLDDEVNRDPDSFLAEITRLNGLIDNCDSVLRDTKKMRKDLRAQLENASEKVGELESKLLEFKLENDSLNLAPTISDDVECTECDAWLNEIKLLNEKNASTVAKLDALRTEYDDLKARPTLLGACKSCRTMHAKLIDARSTISTLEASLKSPVVNACTSCDEVTLRNLKLTSRFDVIYEENNYLRKVLGWLSGQEPQLKIMIEEFKRADGRGLGFEKLDEKVGENSGESVYEKCVESNPEFEVIRDIQVPLPIAPKNTFTPKPNHLCNKLDTTHDPPRFPPKTNDFKKPVKFVSEKDEKPREKPEPRPKPIPFRCEYCGKERHLVEFCYKRKRDERLAREQANQDRYRQSHGIPEPKVPLPRGVGSVRSVGRVGAQGGRFP
jgi:hypothetical protein